MSRISSKTYFKILNPVIKIRQSIVNYLTTEFANILRKLIDKTSLDKVIKTPMVNVSENMNRNAIHRFFFQVGLAQYSSSRFLPPSKVLLAAQ